MTLKEMSTEYRFSARVLSLRLRFLRKLLALENDPDEQWKLRRRIAELTPLLTQMNELADLTAHYYEKGYYRNDKYTMQK